MNAQMTPDELTNQGAIRVAYSPHTGGSLLEAVQFLPQPRERLFEFFSDAFQLEAITPPWLNFSVLSQRPLRMTEGTLIDYQLRLHGIPIRWRSRISVWEPPLRFVDEQICGPYRRWQHEHVLEEAAGGTLCRDVVGYQVLGGRLIDAIFVRSDLRKIFYFRQCKMDELFTSR
jgi:ligand-binding SRPBCC domain-containing protein